MIKTELDKNFLVEAGAGSGKTYNLVERMVNLILRSKYLAEEIVAITFTRKAAAELKERFQNKLEKEYRKTGGYTEKTVLNTALMNLDRCFVGTVHAFCSKMIRERPVEAGVDPDFTELDEVSDAALLEGVWQEYMFWVKENRPELLENIDMTGVSPEELRTYFGKVIAFPEVEIPCSPVFKPDFVPALDELKNLINEALQYIPEPPNEGRYADFQESIIAADRLFKYLDFAQPVNAVRVLSLFEKIRANTLKLWSSKEDAKMIQGKFEHFSTAEIAPLLKSWREYCYYHIVSFLLPGRAFVAKYKDRNTALSYHDTLNRVAGMLRESPAARSYFQGKYRCLLVDEFQDTDPLQTEILFYLTGDNHQEKNWQKLLPRPGSLFVVGDPKQSIYRFRRADIDTYNLAKDLIINSGGEVLNLTTNFRCRPSLGDFCNRVFADLLAKKENPYQALFSPVDAYQNENQNTDYGVRILPTGPAYKKKDQVIPEDARQVAAYIKYALAGNISLARTPAEKDAGLSKAPRAADFLIILPYKEKMDIYARALEEQGIPVTMTGGSSLAGSRELTELVKVIKCLDDPDNPLLVTAVLKSILCGAGDHDLYQYKLAGGYFSLLSPLPELPEQAAAGIAGAFIRKLQMYLKWKRLYPPPVVFEKIIDDLGLVPLALTRPQGERNSSYIYQALEHARKININSGDPFHELTLHLENLMETGPEEEPELDAAGQDTVRLMNLHKAKGLEAPVVILANPYKKVNITASKIDAHIVRRGKKPVGYFAFSGRYRKIAQPPGWDDYAAEELKYYQAEVIRLLYVAATRAKNLLIISLSETDTAMRYNFWRELLIKDNIKRIRPEVVAPDDDYAPCSNKSLSGKGLPQQEFVDYRGQLNDWTEKPAEPGYRMARPSGIKSGKRPGLSFDEGEEAGPAGVVATILPGAESPGTELPGIESPGTESSDAGAEGLAPADSIQKGTESNAYAVDKPYPFGGAEWGTVMHLALEALVKNEQNVRNKILQVLEDRGHPAGHLDAVLEELEIFRKTRLWKDIRNSSETYTEIPFALKISKEHSLHGMLTDKPDDECPVLLRGVIDLAYRKGGTWTIVDYKTDRIPDQETYRRLCDKYAPQVRIYARAWEELSGEKVAECALYFLTLRDRPEGRFSWTV